ncbi:hypothetical protein ACFYU5_09400 [Nocardia aobensis]|uniref:Uncharacterized protein n=2 Tax=Nocardia TaxID=1817 RepID=A0ABU1XQZ9_9NOCA|nr:hypothetical protein [Nocardia kruczakiae]MDR7172377.1 hypothetical protein [Nocardia kruczakiae]
MLKEFLDRQLSFRQMLYLAIMAAVVVGIPYFGIGLIWLWTHHDHLGELHGFDKLFSVIGEIIAWPPLVISDITLK